MEAFKVFKHVKQQYKSYIETFQTFKDKEIETFVRERTEEGEMLWKEPIIQISKKFKTGKSLVHFINEGILHPAVHSIFTLKNKDGQSFTIHPYFHQEQAIDIVSKKQENLIVTTGTGSGKSLCFEIPIIDHCLKAKDKNLKGIKAIVVYPMNALANSQYQELSEKLAGSGLKIGLYTGDTAITPESALARYEEVFGKEARPNDSEIISRLEMKNNPPDILITNYVQLELLLTRMEDKKLFAAEFKENLKFLVLDELHTYSGKQGADVAFLIRRLKQRTNTKGKLTCIGTSATMVSDNTKDDSGETVSSFASRVFGEVFKGENIVVETEDKDLNFQGLRLSNKITVTEEALNDFDIHDFSTIAPLYEGIMGEPLEVTTHLELGNALKNAALLTFLESELKTIQDLKTLAESYQKQYRQNESIADCKLELQAGLLLGTAGEIISALGTPVSRFIPKIHAFYNQGAELRGCLVERCGYLSDKGESVCPKCKEENRGISTLYPLHFCRGCGQKYYGLTLDESNSTTTPWTFMMYEAEGNNGYYAPDFRITDADLPESWLTAKLKKRKKNLKDRYPINGVLRSDIDFFEKHYDDEFDKKGTFIPYPLPFCLSCGTQHSGNVSEYTKLFLLNSVGRATGTNVLATSTLNGIEAEKERKIIGFTDNRQDAAFQAGHLNHWYSQIYLRRALYHVLSELDEPIAITDLPAKLYPYLISKEEEKFIKRTQRNIFKKKYLEYLETYLFVEIRGTKKFTSINLEDVGLSTIEYNEFDEIIEEVDNYELIKELPYKYRHDYIKGILEIFRRDTSIGHPNLLDFSTFQQRTIKFLDGFDGVSNRRIFEAIETTKIGGFTDGDKDRIRHIFNPIAFRNSMNLRKWTERCLIAYPKIDKDELLDEAIRFLEEVGYVVEYTCNYQKVYFLEPYQILIRPTKQAKKECVQCKTKYNWKVGIHCLKSRCKGHLVDAKQEDNYYTRQFIADLDQTQTITSKDHSGQLDGQKRKIREQAFKKSPPEIQFLIATPTMELGIDIGTLSSVYMRNVPPNPSNYAQRAGRAGRSGQGSLIQTFCGSGPGRGVHDQYYYNNPIEIVSGKIAVPRFNLANKTLFMAHVNSLVLQTIDEKIHAKASNILDFMDTDRIPMIPSYIKALNKAITKQKSDTLANIQEAFHKEIEASNGVITYAAIEEQVEHFVNHLDNAFEKLRSDFRECHSEIQELDKQIREKDKARYNYLNSRRSALERRSEDMKNGKNSFYIYRYLSQVGFLPNYAFPTKVKSIKFQNEGEEVEIVRDQIIALRELAPNNTIYYSGQKIVIEQVSRESDTSNVTDIVVCENCNHIEDLGSGNKPSNCPTCGEIWESHHKIKAIDFPRMYGRKRMRITAEEEERSKSGYKIHHSYKRTQKAQISELIYQRSAISKLSFERNADFKHVNLGASIDYKKDIKGFLLDSAKGQWVSRTKMKEHLERNPSSQGQLSEVSLLLTSNNDVITLEVYNIEKSIEKAFFNTLLHTLLQSICNVLNLDDSEIKGWYQPMTNDSGRIVIFETSEGGTGTLSSIAQNQDLIKKIARKSLKILHYLPTGESESDACANACYNCICNFYNQSIHKTFDRGLVQAFLMKLATFDTMKGAKDEHLLFNTYLAQCESKLEERVLHQIRAKGLRMPDASQNIIEYKGEPIAKPDFFYHRNICVFVDGTDHDTIHNQAIDTEKRKKLKALGYRVIVIRYDDLEGGLDSLSSVLVN
jgi:replicative superfamily II helicase